MSSDDMLESAIRFAQELAPQMYDASSLALVQADQRLQDLSHFEHPYLRPLVMRACLRERLKSEGLPVSWSLGGIPQRMGQLILSNNEIDVRVLKERRKSIPGGVPVAGSNRKRRLAWQPSLDIPSDAQAILPKTHLLLLWDFIDPSSVSAGLTLRLVHTVETGTYGKAVKLDLDLDLSEFADGTQIILEEFRPDTSEDDVDFFSTEIAKEENDETGEEDLG